MKVFIKNKGKNNHYQSFMQQFVNSCINIGFKNKKEHVFPSYLLKYLETIYVLFINYIENLLPPKKKALLITSYGDTIFKDSAPYIFNYKIIPILWDVWPDRWNSIYYYLQLFKCTIVFCTVKSFATQLKQKFGIKAYWIPEGIDTSLFQKGDLLINRPIDMYELGRQKEDYHVILEELYSQGIIKGYYRNHHYSDGTYQLAFQTAEEFIEKLPTIKIVISFPRSETHHQQAGNLETLTQRYWECMLSRCLIVGRAPLELIELIGYDPVINIDWNDPKTQCVQILRNIEIYQNLVDKNYTTALQYASWDLRAKYIKVILQKEGYDL